VDIDAARIEGLRQGMLLRRALDAREVDPARLREHGFEYMGIGR
jgi:hypothetical protein